MELSIIVPVYNVEKILNRCIDSLLSQNIAVSYEIILINDGSSDTSPKICDKYKQKYSNIKVIHKDNEGLGLARNDGLRVAKGNYCMFVDSDDYLLPNSINNLLIDLKNAKADTVIGGFTRENHNGKKISSINKLHGKEYTDSQIIREVLEKMLGPHPQKKNYIEMSVWKCIFSMEIINKNKIFFPSERELISEDLPFDLQYYSKCKKVVISKDVGYVYCENNNSLTQKYNPERFNKQKQMYLFLNKEISKYNFSSEASLRIMNNFIGNTRHSIRQEIKYRKFNGKVQVINNINKIVNDSVLRTTLKEFPLNNLSFKQRILTYLIYMRRVKLIYMLYILL